MSDIPIEATEMPGREPPASDTSPAAPGEEPGAAGDEHAGVPVGVEPDSAPATSLPDHLVMLRGHATLEEAIASYAERSRGYPDFASALEAHNARRADHSARLIEWMNGAEA